MSFGVGFPPVDGGGGSSDPTKIPLTYLDTDGTLAANSDTKLSTQKATKTFANTKVPLSYLDTDVALAANSDTKLATQKAAKAYTDTKTPLSYLDTDVSLTANSDTKLATQKATKAYTDSKVRVGKEVILHRNQLSSAGYGITAGMVLVITTNPVDGAEFHIKSGSQDTTYTFRTAPSLPFEVEIGVDVATSVYTLINAINTDGLGVVIVPANITSIDPSLVVAVLYDTGVDPGPSSSRIWSPTIVAYIVNYYGELDYSKSTLTAIPTSDPTTSQFGFIRGSGDVVDLERHYDRDSDTETLWDKDSGTWKRVDGLPSDSSNIITNSDNQVVRSVSTAVDYLALSTDFFIGVTDTSIVRTVSLPSVNDLPVGKLYVIKDKSGLAGTNNIIVNPDGAELIDGQATFPINANYSSLSIITDGIGWYIY